jgi:phospholipid transport system substrate-binding protein
MTISSSATASATAGLPQGVTRRGILGLAAGALLVPFASRMASAQQAIGSMLPIEQLDAALLAAMKAGRTTPFAQRYAMLSPAIEQSLDLNSMLRGAVGFGWYSLLREQKSPLASAFQRYTVSNYAANFDSYDGQSFRVLPHTHQLLNGEVVVRTEIIRPNKSAVEIGYVMRQTAEGWRAIDVLTDGTISQVAVQRSDFGGLLASGGAPALQAGLERKVTTLSGGALA